MRLAFSALVLAAVPCGGAAVADSCSAALGEGCLPQADVLEAMSEQELEAAEEQEADLMKIELLQTSQVHQRAPAVDLHRTVDKGHVDPGPKKEHQQHVHNWERRAAAAYPAHGVGKLALIHQAVKMKEGHTDSHGADQRNLFATPLRADTLVLTEPTVHLIQASIVMVIVVAIIVEVLVYTGRLRPNPKYPQWTLPSPKNDLAIRSYVQDLSVSSVADVERVQSPSGSSSQVFEKPLTSATLVRLEVWIDGLLDRSTMQSPLSQQSCVMYTAAATPIGAKDPLAYSTKRGDFIVSMVDAPWVKILVEGAELLCFGMKGGMWMKTQKVLDKAPEHMKDFVTSQMKQEEAIAKLSQEIDGEGAAKPSIETSWNDMKSFEFEESAILVGSTVTLVGKLCRGPGGQLSLVAPEGCKLPESSPKESCLTPAAKSQYDKDASQDPWAGKILVCDDPAFLSLTPAMSK